MMLAETWKDKWRGKLLPYTGGLSGKLVFA